MYAETGQKHWGGKQFHNWNSPLKSKEFQLILFQHELGLYKWIPMTILQSIGCLGWDYPDQPMIVQVFYDLFAMCKVAHGVPMSHWTIQPGNTSSNHLLHGEYSFRLQGNGRWIDDAVIWRSITIHPLSTSTIATPLTTRHYFFNHIITTYPWVLSQLQWYVTTMSTHNAMFLVHKNKELC